ncbi:hypothetical protein NX862_15345 [Rhodobacter sp. KR11]|uniref:hypothetical protein n=1 Tax=Rhodobacter sp. KR11 TaxID=2974588 RepID=UPI0022234E49|nr:hypothetical protein [Rhodobacter sp. KR11]MCW1920134.1 hypothetical protein [Rhodobacter sp. KR11]
MQRSGGMVHWAFQITAELARGVGRYLFLVFFLISLSLNLAFWIGGEVASAVGNGISAISGIDLPSTRAAKAEVKLAQATAREARIAEKLAASTVREARLTKALALQTLKAKEYYGKLVARHIELRQVRAELAVVSRAWLRAREVVLRFGTVARRQMARWAGDKLSSLVGKAIPYAGTAVAVADVGLDLAMTCDLMKELDSLQLALVPTEATGAETSKVCGMKVPSVDEIWQMVKSSPARAWEASQAVLTSLPVQMPDLPNISWPDIALPDLSMPEVNWPDWLPQP